MSKLTLSAALTGIFFIILGIVLIFDLNANLVWSVILLALGLGFEFGVFGKSYGRFVPGGILTTIGVLFLFCSIIGFSYLKFLWPVFVMAPATGLIQAYFASRKKGLLVSAMVLFAMTAFFFGVSFYQTVFLRIVFGVLIIVSGIALLIPKKR